MNVRNERKQKVFGQLFQRDERCEGLIIKVSFGINVIRGLQRNSGLKERSNGPRKKLWSIQIGLQNEVKRCLFAQ